MIRSSRLSLRFIGQFRHGDLLLLQLANWISGQVLFAAFAAFVPSTTLAHAAFLEVASAFFGTTCTSIALRIGFADVSAMRMLVGARFCVMLVLSCCALGGWIEWTWALGVAPSLLTPAHFPVAYGARRIVVGLLVAFRLLSCAALAWLGLSPQQAFIVYFAPGIAYALLLYVIYFDGWARGPLDGTRRDMRMPVRASDSGRSMIDMLALLPWTSAGLFLIQASIVSGIAAASPAVAVVERLFRSGYSLAYPYLMRTARFDGILRRGATALAFAVPVTSVVSHFIFPAALWIWLPTLSDMLTTNLFRLARSRLLGAAGCTTLCVALLAGVNGLY